MCGIVGMVSSNPAGFNWEHTRLFDNLLWVNTLRGEDSTGVFGVRKSGNVDYLKTVGTPHVMFQDKQYEDFRDEIFSSFHMVVGHNRKATKGSITDENAHPFVEGNTILVHNGTLTNHKSLTDIDVNVDSHAILHSITERGYEDTIKDIQGAFTLAWYDAEDKTLRVTRNKERPLYIANTFGAWFFASEKEMLELVLGRSNTKITEITEVEPGMMYFWDLEDKKNMWYKKLELWSPPKSHTNIIQYVKPEEKTKPEETTATEAEEPLGTEPTYNNTDFPIGTRILCNATTIKTFPRPNAQGYTDLIEGKWYFDDEVSIRIWGTTEEIEAIDSPEDTDNEAFLCTGTVNVVISRKGKIQLILDNLKPYKATFDANGHEIFQDEFIFTNEQCDCCKKRMSFKDAKKGFFEYKSIAEYTLLCQECDK